MPSVRALFWALPSVAILLSAPTTRACSIEGCEGPAVHPASGEVPANQLALLYRGDRGIDGGVAAPHLYKLESDASVEVPLWLERLDGGPFALLFALQPRASLQVGDQLLLEAAPGRGCASAPLRAQYTVTEPRDRPTALGTVGVTVARRFLSVSNGLSCYHVVDASLADLTLTLAAEAQPFAQVVRLELILDGRPRDSFADQLSAEAVREPSARPRSLPRGHERVIANCASKSVPPDPRSFETSPGLHRASIRATFPDGSYLDTPEVEFELRCDDTALPGDPDAGGSTSGPTAGARPAPDAGPEGAPSAPSSTQPDEGGCAVARGNQGTSLPLRALVLFVAFWLLALRRRQGRAAKD